MENIGLVQSQLVLQWNCEELDLVLDTEVNVSSL